MTDPSDSHDVPLANRRQALGAVAALGVGVAQPWGATASAREAAASTSCCPIVELRQYTLHRGGRDVLMELFDRAFIEPQEALGIRIIGQFRDLDDPNRFVWLRGFSDMATRGKALEAFYGGPGWRDHRTTANATMLDSDNVLVLRRDRPDAGFVDLPPRRPPGAPPGRAGLIVANIHYVEAPALAAFTGFFDTAMRPRLAAAGIAPLARFQTEASPNSFPKLPVREHEPVFVWLARFEDTADHQRKTLALAQGEDWREAASPEILRQLARKPEVLRLEPTGRSSLR